MSTKREIRHQFNRQADRFSSYAFSRKQRIFAFIYDFCGLNAQDVLLDIACGSGDFICFCSDRLEYAAGCDISDTLLKIAVNHSRNDGVANLLLCQSDAEHVPFRNHFFSVVTCRSAFHHMEDSRPLGFFKALPQSEPPQWHR